MNNEPLVTIWSDRYRPLQLRDASDGTIRLWDVALRKFDAFLARPATLNDLTDEAVNQFAVWRRDTGASVSTCNRDLASILALWRWCHKMRLIEPWPTVQLFPEPYRIPQAWTESQFNDLLRAAARVKGYVRGTTVPFSHWWTAILLLAFDTGERINAIMSLEWTHVDTIARTVLFRAETRKGRRRDHLLQFSVEAAEAIEKLRDSGSATVFPWPYRSNYLWTRYSNLLQLAGLPNDRTRKFHCIRRTTASHYEAAGGDATKLLGHAARRTTEAYLDPRIVKAKPAYELLFRPKTGFTHPPRPKPNAEQELVAAATSLEQFLDVVYRQRTPLAEMPLDRYRCAIRSLEKFAERTIRIGDLNNALIATWLESMRSQLAPSTCDSYASCVIAIWSGAYKWGFTLCGPSPCLIGRENIQPPDNPPPIAEDELAAADCSLMQFLANVYAKRASLANSTQKLTRDAIGSIESYAGQVLTVHDISSGLIDGWYQHLLATVSKSTANNRRQAIATIVSHAYRWRFIAHLPQTQPVESEVTP